MSLDLNVEKQARKDSHAKLFKTMEDNVYSVRMQVPPAPSDDPKPCRGVIKWAAAPGLSER